MHENTERGREQKIGSEEDGVIQIESKEFAQNARGGEQPDGKSAPSIITLKGIRQRPRGSPHRHREAQRARCFAILSSFSTILPCLVLLETFNRTTSTHCAVKSSRTFSSGSASDSEEESSSSRSHYTTFAVASDVAAGMPS